MMTSEAADKIEKDLNYWRAYEHDGWLVSGFTDRKSVIFKRPTDTKAKQEYLRLDYKQIGFLHNALKQNSVCIAKNDPNG